MRPCRDDDAHEIAVGAHDLDGVAITGPAPAVVEPFRDYQQLPAGRVCSDQNASGIVARDRCGPRPP